MEGLNDAKLGIEFSVFHLVNHIANYDYKFLKFINFMYG